MSRLTTEKTTREDVVKQIKKAGRYIENHADNLLGEFPSLLASIEIKVVLELDGFMTPCIELKRHHWIPDDRGYPLHAKREEGCDE